MRALISVWDKTGLARFAYVLHSVGFEIVSTGGTLRFLKSNGIPVVSVSEVTGFPEILDGRVKTLHPVIHGGILGLRILEKHVSEMSAHGIVPIDVVVSNLYPFRETISGGGASLRDALENIDIGGPAMIRAGAKNFPAVLTVADPADYLSVQEELLKTNGFSYKTRQRLAAKAFSEVSQYDDAISTYLAGADSEQSSDLGLDQEFFKLEASPRRNENPRQTGTVPPPVNETDDFASGERYGPAIPPDLARVYSEKYGELGLDQRFWRWRADLRYGENPHQTGAVCTPVGETGGIASTELLHGIQMSYLNYLDADAAWNIVSSFEGCTCAIVKHANPCGLATRNNQAEAFRHALDGDRVSAFGGIVGFNTAVTRETAEEMHGNFFDVIAAPGYHPDALSILARRKRTRILKILPLSRPHKVEMRSISGGLLIQSSDLANFGTSKWEVVTESSPSVTDWADLEFAWRACRFVRSNAIVFAKDGAITGVGAGQPSRVASTNIAVSVAGEKAKGSVAASDAFFPFPDGVIKVAESGITSLVQPGGSLRDEEVVEAANRMGLAMVFTGMRQFSH